VTRPAAVMRRDPGEGGTEINDYIKSRCCGSPPNPHISQNHGRRPFLCRLALCSPSQTAALCNRRHRQAARIPPARLGQRRRPTTHKACPQSHQLRALSKFKAQMRQVRSPPSSPHSSAHSAQKPAMLVLCVAW
jgi:hypothetical protein